MKHPEECTAYFYLAMSTMAEIDDTVEPEYAPKLREAAERAKLIYLKCAELDTDSQAKLVRPLALGLLDSGTEERVLARLVQAVEDYGYRVGTGFLSTPHALGELIRAGRADVAYKMLLNEELPSWLGEVTAGATTVWEDWEGSLSLNRYSPGAVCQWLFDTCAGIRVAGERRFTIAPVPGGDLRFVQAEYKCTHGTVVSRWEKKRTRYRYTVTVPANCMAEIVLPDGRTETVEAGVHVNE